jgi:hypothetical protein
MTNEQMKAGRFLALHKARRRFNFIVANLKAGNTVALTTYTKSVRYTAKHIGMFKITGKDVWVQHGKSWDCINGVRVTVFADDAANIVKAA